MKTILDEKTRTEIISRILTLSMHSKNQWGKMNVIQMIRHNLVWDEMTFGRKKYKQVFIGKLFGRMALKSVLRNDKPLGRNTPTIADFIINEISGDLETLKDQWISNIGKYANFSNPDFIHPFFGHMSEEQIGQMAYKHLDHHLRQFSA